jgi:DUF1365 family protein
VTDGTLMLLAQPRTLGHVFNPVSFWLAHDRDGASGGDLGGVEHLRRPAFLPLRP